MTLYILQSIHAFFLEATLLSNASLKLAKTQAKPKYHPDAELLLSENYSLCSPTLSYKSNRRYSQKMHKNKCDLDLHIDIYTKYKVCHSAMMVICIKQHLSNI